MSESFFITVNCSKILRDSAESQYTLFIDNSKMSIVYEVIEWIRWMFTIEDCLYITHDNTIIHELEDIQVLSKLKTFVLKPCGQPYCVHQSLYRTLLREFNLFVNWNEMRVHKYFLEKVCQIHQKLNKENQLNISQEKNSLSKFAWDVCQSPAQIQTKEQPMSVSQSALLPRTHENTFLNLKTIDKPILSKTSITDSLKTNFSTNGESPFEDKHLRNLEVTKDNSMMEFLSNAGSEYSNLNETSPLPNKKIKSVVNSTLNCSEEGTKTMKNDGVKKSNKRMRPFSLGALLTNMREEFNKETSETKTSELTNSFSKEEYSEENTTSVNSLVGEDISHEKKRKRTRKRKKAKKETHEFIPPAINENKDFLWHTKSPFKNNVKPNHIRFNEEDEDYLMESENTEANDDTKNNTEICNQINQTSPSNLNIKELTSMINDKISALSGSNLLTPTKEKESENDCPATTRIENSKDLNAFNGESCDNPQISPEASEGSNNSNLQELLSLKNKFKSAVLIERFY